MFLSFKKLIKYIGGYLFRTSLHLTLNLSESLSFFYFCLGLLCLVLYIMIYNYQPENKYNNMTANIRNLNMDACIICNTATDQCCSLCRKVFYCSPEHQEVDWHMKHKFTCQGRTVNEDENNEFKIYSNNYNNYENEVFEERKQERSKSRKKTEVKDEKLIRQFLSLLERRLQMRQKILNQFQKLNQRSVGIVRQSLVHQTTELVELSQQINQTFKNSLTKYLSQQYGILVNSFILNIQNTADNILLCKAYDSTGSSEQVKENLLLLSKNLQHFPTSQTNELLPHIDTYKGTLKAIIQISEVYSLDKIAQTMYGRYIKIVEQFQGIWEQIYAYFNMGVWYSEKTYYEKGIKSFMYSLQLINSHKKDYEQTILFRADCYFNIGLGMWACGDKIKAIQQMQQAYKNRVNGLGKNSLQTSVCLFKLAEWFKDVQKWQQCLQYLDECLRIRKQHPEQVQSLESVKLLISQVYSIVRIEKVKSQEQIQPKTANYYDNLLKKDSQTQSKIRENEEEFKKIIPEESFSSRLLKDQRQFILFKVNITPEMFETYSPSQIQTLNDLFEHTDQKMQKSQAIRILMDSKFIDTLDPSQRQEFLLNNSIS